MIPETDATSSYHLLDAVIDSLACPHCGQSVIRDAGAVRCASGHSFDIARQGYVNMLAGNAKTGTADTPSMLDARAAFFAAGHFAPLTNAIAETATLLGNDVAGCYVDVGAGAGHHLAGALERAPQRAGLALDISKHAARRAARSHPRAIAIVCDTWRPLPIRDGAAAVVLDVFAPRNAAEFHRILAPGGGLLIATPTSAHLTQLAGPLSLVSIDPRKAERIDTALHGRFETIAENLVEHEMLLHHDDIIALVGMGPSSRHMSEHELADRVRLLPAPMAVTSSLLVSSYRAASGAGGDSVEEAERAPHQAYT